MAKNLIYLDYAAATPLDKRVFKTMEPYLWHSFYNPSAIYSTARLVQRSIDAARAKVAFWLGSKPAEITFTAGGSEANNLAIHGLMRAYPEANLVVSAVEHESVLAPAAHYDHRIVKVAADGRLDLNDLKKQINGQTVLVSVMYANNEVGTIQPLKEAGRLISEIRQKRGPKGLPLYLHTDACQATNYLDLHVSRLGVDLMTINGGKIYGPKQSGALFIRGGISLVPLIDGGGQESGLRSGTENVASVIGLAEALELAQILSVKESKRLSRLQKVFWDEIRDKLPRAVINGSLDHRLVNNVHLTVTGEDSERLIMSLDEAGILAAAGSACSASKTVPSHVLRAMGIDDQTARASLRLTMGRPTTVKEVKRTVAVLSELVA